MNRIVIQKNVVMKSYIGNVHANFLTRVNIMMTIFLRQGELLMLDLELSKQKENRKNKLF